MKVGCIENAYTRAVVSACYNYLIELFNDPTSPIKRIYIMCEDGADEGKIQCINYSIGPRACAQLDFGEKGVSFNARFKGTERQVFIEWDRVLMVHSPEIRTNISPMLRDPFGIHYQMIEQMRTQEAEDKAVAKRSKLRLV